MADSVVHKRVTVPERRGVLGQISEDSQEVEELGPSEAPGGERARTVSSRRRPRTRCKAGTSQEGEARVVRGATQAPKTSPAADPLAVDDESIRPTRYDPRRRWRAMSPFDHPPQVRRPLAGR